MKLKNNIFKSIILFFVTISLSSCLFTGGGESSCEYVFTNKSNSTDKVYGCIDIASEDNCPDVKATYLVKTDFDVSTGITKKKLCDIDVEFSAKCNVSLPETIYMQKSTDCTKVF